MSIADSATLEIEIGGTAVGSQYDQLSVTSFASEINNGILSLDGNLQVQLVDGFVPSPSDEFVIVSSVDFGYSGMFNNGSVACVSGGGTFDINYNAGTVTLTNFQPGPVVLGDVNLDCNVNLLDVAPFIDRISTGTFQPEADINDDGAVNLLDVGPFVALLSN